MVWQEIRDSQGVTCGNRVVPHAVDRKSCHAFRSWIQFEHLRASVSNRDHVIAEVESSKIERRPSAAMPLVTVLFGVSLRSRIERCRYQKGLSCMLQELVYKREPLLFGHVLDHVHEKHNVIHRELASKLSDVLVEDTVIDVIVDGIPVTCVRLYPVYSYLPLISVISSVGYV